MPATLDAPTSLSPNEFDLLSFIAQQVTSLNEKFDKGMDDLRGDVTEIRAEQSAHREKLGTLETKVTHIELAESKRENEREKRRQEINENRRVLLGTRVTIAVGALGLLGAFSPLILKVLGLS